MELLGGQLMYRWKYEEKEHTSIHSPACSMIIRLVESKTSAKDAGDERLSGVEPKREETDPLSSLL